jgi:hypothetical protein
MSRAVPCVRRQSAAARRASPLSLWLTLCMQSSAWGTPRSPRRRGITGVMDRRIAPRVKIQLPNPFTYFLPSNRSFIFQVLHGLRTEPFSFTRSRSCFKSALFYSVSCPAVSSCKRESGLHLPHPIHSSTAAKG